MITVSHLGRARATGARTAPIDAPGGIAREAV
jgi:hypothetical protein